MLQALGTGVIKSMKIDMNSPKYTAFAYISLLITTQKASSGCEAEQVPWTSAWVQPLMAAIGYSIAPNPACQYWGKQPLDICGALEIFR
jgi:hypothetical protein